MLIINMLKYSTRRRKKLVQEWLWKHLPAIIAFAIAQTNSYDAPDMKQDLSQSRASLSQLIEHLEPIAKRLAALEASSARLEFLAQQTAVPAFLEPRPWLYQWIKEKASIEQQLIIYALIVIGEGPTVLRRPEAQELDFLLTQLLDRLAGVERFYSRMGGLVGYHLTVLKLIRRDEIGPYGGHPEVRYLKPQGIDLRADSPLRRKAILAGVRDLDQVAEIYVVGGAGDRLNLYDPTTRQPLPAACLQFAGGSLLDLLMRDLQAREYLHYKLFGREVLTPVAMMTSEAKDNHRRIVGLCEERNWFERPKDSFFLFVQPQVPMVTEIGHWATEDVMTPVYRPGGHGALWQLAEDQGVYDWLNALGRRKAIVRQINNPVAGTDHGLLAFPGLGLMNEKNFGFSSCDRRLHSPEGMNVLIETQTHDSYEYRLTNVEYTEFAKHGIADAPDSPGSPYSAFPANTNILFVDLQAIRDTLPRCPMPGMLVNMKTRATYIDPSGRRTDLTAGRLEGTMQNIADFLVDRFDGPLQAEQNHDLQTYISFNHRHRTLSVVKQASSSASLQPGSPDSCFYEMMCNYRELLQEYCAMTVPEIPPVESLRLRGLPLVVQFHPSLGPLYSVIGRKIQGGTLAAGSHWVAEIAELLVLDLRLDGSLQILADNPLGQGRGRRYSEQSGKCILRNVTVQNAGIDKEKATNLWGAAVPTKESFVVKIEGNGEFFAQDVTFCGEQTIRVAAGERMVVTQDAKGALVFKRESISKPTWYWRYMVSDDLEIVLDPQ